MCGGLRARVIVFTLLIPSLLLSTPARALGQATDSDGPVSPDSADVIRNSLERPPQRPAPDALDYATLPLQLIVVPLRMVGLGLAYVVGRAAQLAAPRAHSPILEALNRAGLQPGLSTIGPRSGIAAKVRWAKLTPLFLDAAYSIRQSQRYSAGLAFGREQGNFLQGSYRFLRNAQPYFWGVGPSTPDSNQSDYLWDIQTVSATASSRPAKLPLTGDVAWEDNRVDEGKDGSTVNLQDRPGADTLYGLNERVRYIRGSLGVGADFTHFSGFQRRGIFLELAGAIYRGVDGTDSDFHRFALTIEVYAHLNRRQQLTFRILSVLSRADGGRGIPFYHLARVGSSRGARSLEQDRLRDNDMAALMTEWRYEVWRELHERARVESFLLFDTGGVKNRITDLRGKDLVQSFGFGMRMMTGTHVLFVTYLAFGDEGPRLRAKLDLTF